MSAVTPAGDGGARIRPAAPEDASAIAALHVAGWREAYRGLLPTKVLARLSLLHRAERWRDLLSGLDRTWPDLATFVATGPDDAATAIMGFGCCAVQRAPALAKQGFGGQVLALYVRRADQQQGIGRKLMASMARSLAERPIQGVSLWTLEGNRPCRRFCETLGGTSLSRHEGECGGVALVEVAYGWPELARLASHAGVPTSDSATQA